MIDAKPRPLRNNDAALVHAIDTIDAFQDAIARLASMLEQADRFWMPASSQAEPLMAAKAA